MPLLFLPPPICPACALSRRVKYECGLSSASRSTPLPFDVDLFLMNSSTRASSSSISCTRFSRALSPVRRRHASNQMRCRLLCTFRTVSRSWRTYPFHALKTMIMAAARKSLACGGVRERSEGLKSFWDQTTGGRQPPPDDRTRWLSTPREQQGSRLWKPSKKGGGRPSDNRAVKKRIWDQATPPR